MMGMATRGTGPSKGAAAAVAAAAAGSAASGGAPGAGISLPDKERATWASRQWREEIGDRKDRTTGGRKMGGREEGEGGKEEGGGGGYFARVSGEREHVVTDDSAN